MLPRRSTRPHAEEHLPLAHAPIDHGARLGGPRRYAALPVAVTLVQDAELRTALRFAARGIAHVEHCDSLREAEHALVQHRGIAIVADARAANGCDASVVFARLRSGQPRLVTVVVTDGERECDELTDAVIRTTSKRLRAQVAAALGPASTAARRHAMAEALATEFAPRLRTTVRLAVERGEQPQTIRELAAAAGVPRKTLDRWFATTSALTARQLLAWGRLLAVAVCMDADRANIAVITKRLQFASPSALRNLLQRYAGLTPTELRKAGGARFLFARMHHAVLTQVPSPDAQAAEA